MNVNPKYLSIAMSLISIPTMLFTYIAGILASMEINSVALNLKYSAIAFGIMSILIFLLVLMKRK